MMTRTLPDITGTGALISVADAIGEVSQLCKWYQVTIVSNASGLVGRVGDKFTGASRGIPLGGGTLQTQFAPSISEHLNLYDLKDLYLLIPRGDIWAVAYGA